ncbi:cytochrome c553 [Pseudacidovorax intermedius]|uniref:Cytochrome c553 n=1 Tax=Pseudacidovorax intermedius TaxID=433924 RepID=A0A370FED6_9BURK|nr:cytochrome c [Pseudacidovorax intermedius]RDI22767.1 cytochrome c553 [Pseudacidovorax intermedius]
MTTPPDALWLQWLLGVLQSGQAALLQALHAVGLVPALYGQPAWPWASRLAGDTLLFDLGQARRLALTLGLLVLALVVAALGLLWRRRRVWLVVVAGLLPLLAPWPQWEAIRVAATPASFHVSPTGFEAGAIVRGHQLYRQLCVDCHGADGRGHGPLAAQQAVWPPNLAGPLLWRRADGDLFWHVLHGMRDARSGQPSMPGFADRLSADDAWALIDAMKALAAGQMLRQTGQWLQPVRLPAFAVRCAGAPGRQSGAALLGQRLRVIAPGAGQVPTPDPRVVTVALAPASGNTDLPHVDAADCEAPQADAWRALALVAGNADDPGALAGTQFIVDREGWLRARAAPDAADWQEDDLVCRAPSDASPSPSAPASATRLTALDGLGSLIARMDAEPVRYVKGGLVH